MPPIIFVVFLLNIAAVAVLAGAGWFGWTWYDGTSVQSLDGTVTTLRDDWRLWTALALAGWSFLGRFIVLLFLARSDGAAEKSGPERRHGRWIEGAPGASLYVERFGAATGPVLVMTHGWGLDSTIWRLMSKPLSQRYQIVTWDLPGLGRSKLKGSPVSLECFAENLKRVVSTVDGPVVLVGHSIGGMTIQTLVRDDPEMIAHDVRGIVLLNTTFTDPLRTIIFSPLLRALRFPVIEPIMGLMIVLQPLVWLSAWQGYLSGFAHLGNRLGFGRHVTRSQLDHTALLPTRNPPAVQGRGNLAMFRWDATGALQKAGVPVLVIGGGMDIVTRLEASEAIVGDTPRFDLRVMPGANHMGFLECSDAYADAIAGFVDGLLPLPVVAEADFPIILGAA